MSIECPSCGQRSIKLWQRTLASKLVSVKCSNCKTELYAINTYSALSLATNFIAFGFLLYSFYMALLYSDFEYIVLLVLSLIGLVASGFYYRKLVVKQKKFNLNT